MRAVSNAAAHRVTGNPRRLDLLDLLLEIVGEIVVEIVVQIGWWERKKIGGL